MLPFQRVYRCYRSHCDSSPPNNCSHHALILFWFLSPFCPLSHAGLLLLAALWSLGLTPHTKEGIPPPQSLSAHTQTQMQTHTHTLPQCQHLLPARHPIFQIPPLLLSFLRESIKMAPRIIDLPSRRVEGGRGEGERDRDKDTSKIGGIKEK